MRAEGLAECDGGRELTLLEVDNVDRGAVGAGLTYAGVAINGDISEARVGRDCDLMAVHTDRNFGKLAATFGVNKQHRVFLLIGHHKGSMRIRRRGTGVGDG